MKGHNSIEILFGKKYEQWDHPQSILSSVTPIAASQKMVEIARTIYPKSTTVWDPFGGSGRDTVSFSKYFDTVTCEHDDEMFQSLESNVQRFHSKDHTYTLHHTDSTIFRPPFSDLVYLDPPWGESFRSNEEFALMNVELGQTTAMKLIEDIRENVSTNIIVKSPIKNENFRDVWGDRVKYEVHFDKYKLKFFYLT